LPSYRGRARFVSNAAIDNEIGTCARAALNLFDTNPAKVEAVRSAPAEAQYTLSGNKITQAPAEVVYTPLRK
jgi:hypothetical protein